METAIQTKPTRVQKERPILFSAPMVQAILEGRKTQTRRAVKPEVSQLIDVFLGGEEDTDLSFGYLDDLRDEDGNLEPAGWYVWCTDYPYECAMNLGQCPYGMEGDKLWVRETWAETLDVNNDDIYAHRPHIPTDYFDNGKVRSAYIFRADGETDWCDGDGFSTERSYWRPSIFMPRKASRILLEITHIRIEQLQEISYEDAKAEGVKHVIDKITGYCGYNYEHGGYNLMTTPYHGFKSLWRTINGKESWDVNPWVWVVEFKVQEVKGGL